MPIYEYKCLECGNHLETMQKMSDEPLTECANCGGKLEKQWSRTGFQFKGTGWYVTDYAGKGAESKTETANDSKTETKSESKTETTTATDTAKTSASGESTAASDSASKPETKTTSSDKT
jgi:putative FmdB family regulatory protein